MKLKNNLNFPTIKKIANYRKKLNDLITKNVVKNTKLCVPYISFRVFLCDLWVSEIFRVF
jgi:hypothetical protein